MLGEVNAAPANAGRPALSWNSHLAAVAGEQADRMAAKHRLYHNPNLAADVGNYRWVGENVGYGPSSSSIQKAFMKSAPHRANILDGDFTQIGIASVRDDDGRLWVAQVFRQPLKTTSSSPAKKATPKKAPAGKPTAKKAAPKKKAPATTTRSSRSQTSASNATAPARTRKPEPQRPKATKPAPAPTLEQRVSFVTAQNPAPASDPLADALAFAVTMNAVGG